MLVSENSNSDFGIINENLLKEDVGKKLTSREKEIFELLFSDFTTREIGEKLHISHVMVIKVKKKIRNRCRKFKSEIIGIAD